MGGNATGNLDFWPLPRRHQRLEVTFLPPPHPSLIYHTLNSIDCAQRKIAPFIKYLSFIQFFSQLLLFILSILYSQISSPLRLVTLKKGPVKQRAANFLALTKSVSLLITPDVVERLTFQYD